MNAQLFPSVVGALESMGPTGFASESQCTGYSPRMRVAVLPPRGEAPSPQGPWAWLCDGLRQTGQKAIVGRSFLEAPEAVVAINDQPEAHALWDQYAITLERRVLVALEPAVSLPRMFRPSVYCKYGHRFAASPIWAHELSAEAFPWPHTISPHSMEQQGGAFRATMINAEKRSAVSASLYSLRRQVIKACDTQHLDLAVFGPGWGDSLVQRFRSATKAVARAVESRRRPAFAEAFSDLTIRPRYWMGFVDTKAAAFANAQATVIIENSPDYVSEKLLDAVANGVAPLYVGPPLQRFGIPKDVAIQCLPSAISITSNLADLHPSRVNEVIEAGRDWIHASCPNMFDARTVLTSLGRRIGNALNHA